MITQKSNHDIKPRKTLKISDLSILWSIKDSDFPKDFFKRTWVESFILLVRKYLRFDNAARAFQFWMVFRGKPGKKTFGLIVLFYCLVTGIAYNSIHVPYYLKPFVGIIVPFVPFFKSWEEIHTLVFVDIESPFLTLYLMLLTILTCMRLALSWLGDSNLSDTKRGESFIVRLLSKYRKVNEFFICIVVETIIGIGIGFVFWHYLNDPYLGAYMIYITLSETYQGIMDKAYQSHIESLLKI